MQGVFRWSRRRRHFLRCHQHHPEDARRECRQTSDHAEIVRNSTRSFGIRPGADIFYEISAISIDWLGGISRLDYYIFTYTFASTELARKKASVIACCVVESSANIKGIDPNTLRVIISRAFRGGDVAHSTLSAIYAQLITAMNEPQDRLSLTDHERKVLESWYQPTNQKLLTGGTPAGTSPINPAPALQPEVQVNA